MKKICIIGLMVLIMTIQAFAGENEGSYDPLDQGRANQLKDLGLFKGSDKGYELERPPRRVESAVMLIRLLGVEGEVLNGDYAHPFTDVPTWANNYIGYMYENGLTKGVGNNKFGSNDPVSTKSYCTFLLRALGYDDSRGEFNWKTAAETAVEKGILEESDNKRLEDNIFLRGDMVSISHTSLLVNRNGESHKLIDRLVEGGAVESDKATVFIEKQVEIKEMIKEAIKTQIIGNKVFLPVSRDEDGKTYITGKDIQDYSEDVSHVMYLYSSSNASLEEDFYLNLISNDFEGPLEEKYYFFDDTKALVLLDNQGKPLACIVTDAMKEDTKQEMQMVFTTDVVTPLKNAYSKYLRVIEEVGTYKYIKPDFITSTILSEHRGYNDYLFYNLVIDLEQLMEYTDNKAYNYGKGYVANGAYEAKWLAHSLNFYKGYMKAQQEPGDMFGSMELVNKTTDKGTEYVMEKLNQPRVHVFAEVEGQNLIVIVDENNDIIAYTLYTYGK